MSQTGTQRKNSFQTAGKKKFFKLAIPKQQSSKLATRNSSSCT